MDVVSLGFRTDLALLRLGGSLIEDRGDHLVVTSPQNPTFWWGNFILLDHVPPPEAAGEWVDVFRREFPDQDHLAIGIDGRTRTREDAAGFAALGLKVETSSVMTAQSVHEPPHPNMRAEYRRLESDQDWADHVELRVALEERYDKDSYRVFVTDKARSSRAIVESGNGAWFGAFIDGRLLSTMGLVRADADVARFQNVETHPEARGQGLAGTLVEHVSRYGFDELGATTLVMVADPDYVAIRVYRAVGFTSSETQLQIERTRGTD
ncbi:MAG TPA: GNAT family N-acetyltransferase [Nocardioidaceae bacterium]